MEKEKRAILAQRIEPIAVDGLDVAKLKEYAQTLHDKMRTLVANKYDLEERFKRQQYDVRTQILLDFLLTVKGAPHECVIRTSQP